MTFLFREIFVIYIFFTICYNVTSFKALMQCNILQVDGRIMRQSNRKGWFHGTNSTNKKGQHKEIFLGAYQKGL